MKRKTVSRSEILFKRALQIIPGGVNSPVRAFGAVGGTPLFIERGAGSRIYSAEGREFIDFCGSWGPLIMGHAHPSIVEAIQRAAAEGTSFGACTEREIELAELMRNQIPFLERVRMVNSGTEATMTAVRLARGFTGRKKILKFDGCYHGHADSLLVSAGSGLLTCGIPTSSGIPEGVVKNVLVAPYNDLEAVELLIERHGKEIAAVIVEPVAGNMGLVLPTDGFLPGLRKLTKANGILLIFDEVITGFRLGPTTYGVLCDVTPDLTCLGKIIGGGMPMGAIGGKREIMEKLAPLGPVYQAGTLSGNPLAVAAGLSALKTLVLKNPYPELARQGDKIAATFRQQKISNEAEICCVTLGSMFTIFFNKQPALNLTDVKNCNTRRYACFFHEMLKRGVYLPPSQFETCFISTAHTDADIKYFLNAVNDTVNAELAGGIMKTGISI